MANRESKLLKAWVRYDGNGEIIPSSIIYRKRKPAGKFKELIDPAVEPCCTVTPTTTAASCASAGFWEDENTQIATFESGDGVQFSGYSQTTNFECNSFLLTINYNEAIPFGEQSVTNAPVIIKYDADGTQLWSKAYKYFSEDFGTNAALSTTLCQDAEGNTYLTFQSTGPAIKPEGIIKLDPLGNILWCRVYNGFYDGETKSYKFSNAKVSSFNGYLYVIGRAEGVVGEYSDYDGGITFLAKINPTNGDIEVAKAYYSTIPATLDREAPATVEQYGLAQFDITPEGDLVFSQGLYIYSETPFVDYYPLFVVKVDSGLNIIWANYGQVVPPRCIDPSCSSGYADFELMSVQVDRFGYIYGNGWGQDIVKLNSDGTVNFQIIPYTIYTSPFAYTFNNYTTIVEGNNLWSISSNVQKSIFTGNPADNSTYVCTVMNLDLYGNMRWATSIETVGMPYTTYMYGPEGWDRASAENDVLYFNLYSADYNVNPTPNFITQIKLSSTQQTGTFGTLAFTDVTSVVRLYSPNDLQISFQNLVTVDVATSDWSGEYTCQAIDVTTTSTLTTIPA